jgi:SAM-dependent methyltransferase
MITIPPVGHPSYWDERYLKDEADWDMRTPTPVFVDVLAGGRCTPGSVLVLGCGKGHDAVLFARHGFMVTAVDFSDVALSHTKELAAASGVALSILRRDLFTLTPEFDDRFDYVVEYVTFCAIDPQRRPAFADVVCKVLKPGGRLIGLFFPIDGRAGGPPFSVNEKEITRLFARSCDLETSELPERSVKPRRGKEILMIWRKRNLPAQL